MKLTAEQIQENYKTFLSIIDHYVTGDRKEKVLDMVKDLEDEIAIAPASGKNWYHGAYPGGYIVHVIKVVTMALKIKKLYESQGGKIDFTDEQLVFSALFHDLGKVGLAGKPNYIPQDSDWHRKNQGSMYKQNGDLDFMLIPDRSLFMLQSYGVQVDQTEYLAILTHDGLYEETNKPYYLSYTPDAKFKSSLPKILHHADDLAASLELDIERENDNDD